jgi:acyl-coenzyme A synthetase/AMP-(fatty) acid ligase
VGRAADLLNVGGRRVSAAALEAALRGLDGVDDAAVVAVDDALRGDRVIGFVVGAAPVIDPARLPAGLAPRSIRRLDALPYTARGKLDRSALRRLAQS